MLPVPTALHCTVPIVRSSVLVTIELVKARASLGEIVARLRRVWGSYIERPVF